MGWGSFLLHWFFYNVFEDVQEKAPTKVPNHDKLVVMGIFDNTANQRAPGQLQFNDCTRPSPRVSL